MQWVLNCLIGGDVRAYMSMYCFFLQGHYLILDFLELSDQLLQEL